MGSHFCYRWEDSNPNVSDGGIPTLVVSDVSQPSFFAGVIIVENSEFRLGFFGGEFVT